MLSIIIPYCNEYPQIAFTVQSIVANCGLSPSEYEIITINNHVKKVTDQGFPEDKGSKYLDALISNESVINLKNIRYDVKLSHWGAKNAGVMLSSGETLLFLDAHVFTPYNLIGHMYQSFHEAFGSGPLVTAHMPLSYLNEPPGRELIYRARINVQAGVLHYVFHKAPYLEFPRVSPFGHFAEVPVMSSCGMMIRRKNFDVLQGWPSCLGIYGGGENYVNYAMAILGGKKYIFTGGAALYHYAEERGYRYERDDWLKNRMIATFLAGGEEWLIRCVDGMDTARKASRRTLIDLMEEVLYHPELESRRAHLAANQQVTPEEWIKQWQQMAPELIETVYGWV